MNPLLESLPPSALDSLSPQEAEELRAELSKGTPWVPNEGPQSRAYLSLADELYYGGAAGGGKTQLAIGLALTSHQDSLILRRRAVDAKSLSKAFKALNYGSWKWNGSGGELRTPDGRTIEVGGCEHIGDESKYQGNPHDLIVFDELPHFAESQYTFIIGWNRPLDPRRHATQRCRVVCPGNPPTSPEGEWVLKRWGAWMPGAKRPAKTGELRWFTTIAGEDVECESGTPFVHDGAMRQPRSRTFIPAKLEDNPDLLGTGYAATLEAMPEPLRSMLRYGDMLAGSVDDAWQLIPTKWIVAAQRRWAERRERGWGALTAVGVDPARGGADRTAVAPRHGTTIADVVCRKGAETPDGNSVVVLFAIYGNVPVNIDTIGVGASAYDVARTLGMKNVHSIVVSNACHWRDPKLPLYKFVNLRSAMMWKVRSLLDPEGGPPDTRLALPPYPELLGDLRAPRYALRAAGVQVESKDDIKDRIGRSTDCFVAGTLVLTAYGNKPIESIRLGELVWTRAGLRRVAECGTTFTQSETRRVVFSDGRILKGTPEHPIFVVGKGFIPIDALAFADRIITWGNLVEKNVSHSRGWFTPDTPIASLLRGEGTSTTSQPDVLSIRRFGNPFTDPSPMECTFITRTKTHPTTSLATSNYSHPLSITSDTATRVPHNAPTLKRFANSPLLGTHPQRGGLGIRNMESEHGITASQSSERAPCVRISTSAQPFATPTGFVLTSACNDGTTETRRSSRKPSASCVNSSSFARRARNKKPAHPPARLNYVSVIAVLDDLPEPVYNLTVEGLPEYFANGVLVHNCGDAVGLACWEKPEIHMAFATT